MAARFSRRPTRTSGVTTARSARVRTCRSTPESRARRRLAKALCALAPTPVTARYRVAGALISRTTRSASERTAARCCGYEPEVCRPCLLYTSDAADDLLCVDL